MEENKVILFFDGGSRGNPGLAYGSFRVEWEGERVASPQRRRFGQGTNNEAEYKALLAGLEHVKAEVTERGLDLQNILLEIRGDSALVVEQLLGNWKVKSLSLQSLHDRALEILRDFGGYDLIWKPRRDIQRMLGH